MSYQFDEIIDRRNTNALNTDGFRGGIFHAGPDRRSFPTRTRSLSACGWQIWSLPRRRRFCQAICQRVAKIDGASGYSQILRRHLL